MNNNRLNMENGLQTRFMYMNEKSEIVKLAEGREPLIITKENSREEGNQKTLARQ